MRYVECSPEGTFEPAAGAEALVGPRRTFADGDPFLAGGGAVDLVSLDELVWNAPREREEAGSPNVVGAVAFGAAARALEAIGWPVIRAHDERLAVRVRSGLGAIEGIRVLGPGTSLPKLPVASFVVEGVHHALVAAGWLRSGAPACAMAASAPIPTCFACSRRARPDARRLRNRVGRPRCGASTSTLWR